MGEVTDTMNRDLELEAEKVRHSSELSSRLRAADHESPEEIRREIERTRREMDETLSTIRYRMEMEELATDAFESVKKVWREKHPNVFGAARRNPGPTAVAALGLGWMIARGATDGELEGRMRQKISQKASDVKHRLGEKTHQARERIGGRASQVKERIGQKADEIRHSAGEGGSQFGQQVKGRASEMLHGTAEGTRHMMGKTRENLGDSLQSNPFAVGALALTVGAACGLLFPLSSAEERVIHRVTDESPENVPGGIRKENPPETTMEKDMGWSGDYSDDIGI